MRGETARNNKGLGTSIHMMWRRPKCWHVEVKPVGRSFSVHVRTLHVLSPRTYGLLGAFSILSWLWLEG